MKSKYILTVLLLLCISCKAIKETKSKVVVIDKLSILEMQTWHQLDNQLDGIPGISLKKWYSNSKVNSKQKIIVAVIDTQIDLEHEDLQGQFWKNEKEIPNNNIDDDFNGYIDDVNGWNYLGTKSGNYVVWANYSYVRYVRKWKPIFGDKKKEDISAEDLNNYNEYLRAVSKLKAERAKYDNWLNSLIYAVDFFPKSKDTLKHFFPKEDYTYGQLDSLYKIYKINDKIFRQRRLDKDQDLGALIDFMRVRFEQDEKTLDKVLNMKEQVDSSFHKNLNIDYNERVFIDGATDEFKKGYGSNNVNYKIKGIRSFNTHSTEVSGIIAACRTNAIGIKGFSNNIKIMPLTVVPSGDEYCKDVALAIRYAVDNGAKVINMSFTQDFSVDKEFVFEAIKYAEKNNVLLVHCAGNDGYDIDVNPKYPTDRAYSPGSKEFSSNFINVGSISKNLDSTFVSNFSNYGKENVDLFAPGEEIYTTIPDNKYRFDSGTSLSGPMVSGTAALLWLYYPKLTVQEVKQIILESGTSYDIDVLVPDGEGKKLPFKELSKSGKVLNVYNAMKMAKEMSNLKK